MVIGWAWPLGEKKDEWRTMGEYNQKKAELFDRKNVIGVMEKVYREI